eukprot:2362121-Alexandrium_andersonii.AAC.1
MTICCVAACFKEQLQAMTPGGISNQVPPAQRPSSLVTVVSLAIAHGSERLGPAGREVQGTYARTPSAVARPRESSTTCERQTQAERPGSEPWR